MSYTIPNNNCNGCDICRPHCPTGAIKLESNDYWIDPSLCDNCVGYDKPQCVVICPTGSPIPRQAKKGRCKVDNINSSSLDLFVNGKNSPFASAIAIWEACNVLAQRTSLPWLWDEKSKLCYSRQVSQGKGAIAFHIQPLRGGVTSQEALQALDIRATCIHLIFAAYATTVEKPWEQEFIVDDRQIEKYLGLKKRKDLSKTDKLTFIKQLVEQTCSLVASINWFSQGRFKAFTQENDRIWQLIEIQHHLQEDEMGSKYLVGLTFKIKAGAWSRHFLNKHACKEGTAFYQYGSLPQSLLTSVMSIWQQHEGAARLMLWLLFKTRMGIEQRITVPTLLRVGYGEEKIAIASQNREERKRLLRTFESDLEVLNNYGLKPVFDPVTYPVEIQPLWTKLVDIPEDPDEALEFWINDANSDNRLTDRGPRGKWNLLMNARILNFELPPDWQGQNPQMKKKQRHIDRRSMKSKVTVELVGEQIQEARQQLNISQRELAKMTGKSQSWIRDIENGRLKVKVDDQALLKKVLGIV